MGVKGLSTLLKKVSPTAYIKESFDKFRGEKVAIDAFGWMWSSYNSAFKKVTQKMDLCVDMPEEEVVFECWINSANQFLYMWLKNDITPVFVFDGKKIVHKEKTQKERIEKSKQTKQKLLTLIKEVSQKDILDRTTEDIEGIRTLLRQGTYPNKINRNRMKDYLESLGIPVLQAVGDGEQLCSFLCRKDYVKASYSVDSDNLAFGCKCMIQKVDALSDQPLSCLYLDKILETIGLNYLSFVDLCIMMGCDYNDNIKGIGPVKALKLITDHHSIDNLPIQDVSVLNHDLCRKIFTCDLISELVDGDFNESSLLIKKKTPREYVQVETKYCIQHILPLLKKLSA